MKALTVKQPHASRLMNGPKHIETRTWSAPTSLVGQRIAIHAGARHDGALPRNEYPRGVVLGTMRLADCVRVTECSDLTEHVCRVGRAHLLHHLPLAWGDDGVITEIDISDQLGMGTFDVGGYAWFMVDPVKLRTPIPARGQQGLWEWNG